MKALLEYLGLIGQPKTYAQLADEHASTPAALHYVFVALLKEHGITKPPSKLKARLLEGSKNDARACERILVAYRGPEAQAPAAADPDL